MDKITHKLFWIDLEMTGLDVKKEVILEVAAVITDMDFNVLGDYHAVLKQPQKYLDAMDDWNTKHHNNSGLVAKVPHGIEPAKVEADLIALADKHFGQSKMADRPILAGNSIGQDRLFIDAQMPNFSDKLHYRMLDVSSWKIIFNNKFGLKHDKQSKHRALDDIHESIAELKFYLSHLKI